MSPNANRHIRNFLLAAAAMARRCRKDSADIVKIRGSIYYLKGVKLFRTVSILVFSMFGALILGFIGLITLHALLLFILPVTLNWRIAASIALVFIDTGIATGLYMRVFSEKTWLKLSNTQQFLERLSEEMDCTETSYNDNTKKNSSSSD